MDIILNLVRTRRSFEDVDYIYKHCFDDKYKSECIDRLMKNKHNMHPYTFNSLLTYFRTEELDIKAREYSDGATYPDFWEDRY